MSGLFTTLRQSVRSLANFETGLANVSNNVANVNTPGYTRKRVLMAPSDPIRLPIGALGTGADVIRIESVRDSFLDRRLVTELQNRGYFEGQQFGLAQVEARLYSSEDSGIAAQITKFFNSFSELSADAASPPLRQNVLAEATRLTREFAIAADGLGATRNDNRQLIRDSVDRINQLADEIAELNQQILPYSIGGQDPGSLKDQQQRLMNEMAELVDFNTVVDEAGLVQLTTRSGRPIVNQGNTFEFTVDETPAGADIFLAGEHVTDEIQAGKLGGYLELDRNTLPAFMQELNDLAEEFAIQVNTLHTGGVDLDGAVGQPLFSFVPGGAASSLQVTLTDYREVAAAAPGGGVGDATVAQQIVDLQDQVFASLDGDTFGGYYSQIVFRAGLEGRDIGASLNTQSVIVDQLEQQINSVSGVSLDEEAVDLLQLQRSYQAGARLISVVDGLLEETMNMIR